METKFNSNVAKATFKRVWNNVPITVKEAIEKNVNLVTDDVTEQYWSELPDWKDWIYLPEQKEIQIELSRVKDKTGEFSQGALIFTICEALSDNSNGVWYEEQAKRIKAREEAEDEDDEEDDEE